MRQNVSDFYMIAVWKAERLRKALVEILAMASNNTTNDQLTTIKKKAEAVLRETEDD